MNSDRVQGLLRQFNGKLKEQWGRLTDDDLDVINGRQEQLAPTDGCPGHRASERSPSHQRHRACPKKRLSLVRLPARVCSSDNDL